MRRSVVISILNEEYKVIVCFGDSKVVSKVLKDWGHDSDTASYELENRRGVCFYHRQCHPVIALPRFPKTPTEIGTLAHESIHAVNNIMEKVGQEWAEEVFAHSVGAVVRKVLSSNKKPTKNKS